MKLKSIRATFCCIINCGETFCAGRFYLVEHMSAPQRRSNHFDVTPAIHLVLAAEYAGDRFRVGKMLLFQNALGKGGRVVGIQNRYDALKNDDAVIESFVHEMNRAASMFYTVVERL